MKQNVLAAVLSQIGVRATLVRTVHGFDERNRTYRHKILAGIEHLVTDRLFDVHVAVSQELQTDLCQRHPRSRVAFIPNGVDAGALQALYPAERAARSPRRVGFVGRLVRVKRVDLFLRAAALIAERSEHQLEFIVCGEGPEEGDLCTLADLLALEDVHFMGFSEKGAQVISTLNVLVLTSDSEGMPMTVLEATALGVPVVSRDVGAVSQIVGGVDGGWMVESDDPAAIADAIERALSDHDIALARSAHACARVTTEYSTIAMEERYYVEYLRASAQPSNRHLTT